MARAELLIGTKSVTVGTNFKVDFYSFFKMSDCSIRDSGYSDYSDYTGSVGDVENDEINVSEVLDKNSDPSARNGMFSTSTDRTGTSEGPPPKGPNSSATTYIVNTAEDSQKKDLPKTKSVANMIMCLITLLVTFVIFFFAAGAAIIFSFFEIYKLRSELAMLQSTDEVMNVQQSAIDQLISEVNSTKLNVELNLENISNNFSTQQRDIDQLSSRVSHNTRVTKFLLLVQIFSSISLLLPLVTITSGPPMVMLLLHTVI